MQTSNPLEILLEHDHWATRQLLEACKPLTPEQFHKPFEMGPGSLHNTTTHLLGAKRLWCDVLSEIEPRPRLDTDGQRRTPDELMKLLDEIGPAFMDLARSRPLDGMVMRVRDGQVFKLTRAGVITQVTTHGMHHRAQCLNMLRHLGVHPLPPSSVIEWIRAVDSQR